VPIFEGVEETKTKKISKPQRRFPMPVQVTRLPIQLVPDAKRVITRFFGPGDENRMKGIITRLLAIPAAELEALLESVESSFLPLHPDIDDVFLQHFE
jgi:hypothetical protein